MSRSGKKSAVVESLELRTLLSGVPGVMGYVEDFKLSPSTVNTVDWKALNQVNYFAVLPQASPAYNAAFPTSTPEQAATSDGALQATSDSGYNVAAQLQTLVGDAHTNGEKSVNVYLTLGAGDPNAIYDMDALVNASPAVWTSFADNLKTFCNSNELNGVDLDWEPSIQGFTVTATQIENFGKLVQTVHNAFSSTGLKLTADALGDPVALSTAAGAGTGQSAYTLDALAVANVDQINVEAYPVASESAATTIMAQWADYITGHASSINPAGTDVADTVVHGSPAQLQFGLDISTDDTSNTTAVVTDKVDTTVQQGYGGLFVFDVGEPSSTSVLSTIAVRIATDTRGGSIAGVVKSTTGVALSGETVYLDANNNSKLDSGELTTITSPTGAYSFNNVLPGAYIVRQVLGSGVSQTSPTKNYGIHLSVSPGSSSTNDNFTDKTPAAGASISGAIKTAAGVGLAGVTVYLDANNNSLLDPGETSAVTLADGTYRFPAIPAGAYIIRQILPTGDTQTLPTKGYGIHITVTNTQTLTSQNFTDTVLTASQPIVIAPLPFTITPDAATTPDAAITLFNPSPANSPWADLDLL